MRRLATLIALALAACQQAAVPGNETAANQAADATRSTPPSADTPGAPPSAMEPVTIPPKFRGLWAEDQAACGQLSHLSRLVISDRTVGYPSFVLAGETIELPDDDSVAVKGRNAKTNAATEAHYSVDATGSILTDEAGGGAVRVRCQ